MKKLLKFVFVTAFVLGGWALAAASLHVVRAPGKMLGYVPFNVQLVPKSTLTFKDTYVDTTNWTVADVDARPAFKARLDQAGKTDLLEQARNTPAPDTKLSVAPATTPPAVKVTETPATPAVTSPAEPPKQKSIFDFK